MNADTIVQCRRERRRSYVTSLGLPPEVMYETEVRTRGTQYVEAYSRTERWRMCHSGRFSIREQALFPQTK
jgi:hypothetical protein